ncbi:hypothetical protein [Dorea sp.]
MNTLIITEAVLIIKGETTVQLRISAVLLRKAGRWDVPYAFREADEEKCSKRNVSEDQGEEQYLLKEKEIAKYIDACKNDAFVLFSKYFFDLWI